MHGTDKCDHGAVELFEVVGEALRGMVPPDLGALQLRHHRYGIKIWFGPAKPTRVHYEAQVIGPKHVAEAEILAIEVGLHAEHRQAEENDAALALVAASERRWRNPLGTDPVIGAFLGGSEDWRRISETWADPDLGDEDLAMELVIRLLYYMMVFEPLLREGGA